MILNDFDKAKIQLTDLLFNRNIHILHPTIELDHVSKAIINPKFDDFHWMGFQASIHKKIVVYDIITWLETKKEFHSRVIY